MNQQKYTSNQFPVERIPEVKQWALYEAGIKISAPVTDRKGYASLVAEMKRKLRSGCSRVTIGRVK